MAIRTASCHKRPEKYKKKSLKNWTESIAKASIFEVGLEGTI
jgi:hypothetical protein